MQMSLVVSIKDANTMYGMVRTNLLEYLVDISAEPNKCAKETCFFEMHSGITTVKIVVLNILLYQYSDIDLIQKSLIYEEYNMRVVFLWLA